MGLSRRSGMSESEQVRVLKERVRLLEECLVANDASILALEREAYSRAMKSVPLHRWRPGKFDEMCFSMLRAWRMPVAAVIWR